jgi:hypothetical protein
MFNRFWIAATLLLSPAIANAWEEQQALEFTWPTAQYCGYHQDSCSCRARHEHRSGW